MLQLLEYHTSVPSWEIFMLEIRLQLTGASDPAGVMLFQSWLLNNRQALYTCKDPKRVSKVVAHLQRQNLKELSFHFGHVRIVRTK